MSAPSITVTTVNEVVTVNVTFGVKGDKGDPGDTGSASTLEDLLDLLGVPTYANLTAANAALAIGSTFYNQDTATLAITTA